MTTDEIMKKIREGLTGEYSVDMVYLESQADKYRSAKNAKEIGSAIADLAYEILPDDKREVLNKMMYIDGKRLDVVFAEANKLIQEKKIEESFKLTEALYTKIRMNYRETESEVYLSFRNTLEHQLYLYFYRPSKKLVRPVFDLSQMILLHGYNLLELNRAEEAARVINDAIRYNPMNTDAYFELAECYKSLRDHDQLLSVIKETLEVAVTPVQISRCYCNLGFYCVEVKDYDRAVCFYYESLIYAEHPFVPGELHHIYTITKKKITPTCGIARRNRSGRCVMQAPTNRPPLEPPTMAILSLFVYFWSIRYSAAEMKSSNTFCFCILVPATCQSSPYSLPPRRLTCA